RKKGALDAKRSKIFSRIIKEIQVAVRDGGADPEGNPRLRLALNNARGANMPKDNIQRALSKADKDSAALLEYTFEGYAPYGIAVFIECLSDNNLRTVSSIRSTFSKRGGNLGTNGSVAYMFDRKGIITVPKGTINAEEFELEIIDAGAEDLETTEEHYIITTALEDFASVQKKLEDMGIQAENAELQRVPKEAKQLPVEQALKVLRIIEEFEEDDDVQNVFHNLEVTEEVMAAME
ncbi:MAG: YebC/PmpR family DNA-binding transcriptional regulator, partial [Bacteroidetes bacterium]|nr:YebC/PmpR family DNA-binding transcriptional regulator [Bacteroidota bacterium]